ncbi:Hypothetical predicted protein [Cloeon dipterum]|uniref:Cysteine-rich DPF motif domain-containing protein 1 n=1 Tax=Cloeon dipterum TaxID=197152 RepID=A0A8S1BQQ6_9INSE|nr:Hypothetical predicted protein [Cloeon dipterum]
MQENEVPIQGFDQQAKKKEEAEGGTFCCSICRLEETYHCRGPVPYFCKTVRVSPDSYIARDPFMPPGQRSFLLLGSDCYACSKPVCQACSLFFAKRFCKPCAVVISYQDDYEESKFDFSDLCPLSYRVVQIVQNSSDQVFHLKKSLEDRSNDAKQIQALVKSGVDSTLEVIEKFGKYLEKMDRETRMSDRKMHQEIMVKLEQDGKKVSSEISSMFSKFEENNNRLFENMKSEIRAATLPILEELNKFERKVSQFDNEFQALESKTKTALGQIDRFNCSKYYEKLTVTTLQNGKKYYLGDKKVTWRDAKHICEENDMSLASLKTRREIKLLWRVAKIDKESGSWLSASDIGRRPGHFVWRGGERVSREKDWWAKNEPNDFGKGKEACIGVFNDSLFSDPCNYTAHFICELPAECY